MTTEWTAVAAETDLLDGAGIGVQVQGRHIALFSIEGQAYATDNYCTHGNALLCDGFIEGNEVECPFHQGRFDVRTGAPTCAPVTEAIVVPLMPVFDCVVVVPLMPLLAIAPAPEKLKDPVDRNVKPAALLDAVTPV